MKHGGDILTYKDLYEGEIIDFSSNINPLGPPKGLKEVINNGFEKLIAYPDIQYRELKAEIAEYLGCNNYEVIVGNGAVEIINNVISMFKRVVVFTPCFSEYIKRAEILKKDIVKLPLDKEFNINVNTLIKDLKGGDLVVLGNPNNPTGKRIDIKTLKHIHKVCLFKGAFLLLDEAFFEFCPEDYDSISIFKNSKNVCIIRAATKFFGLPGIRLGYAFSNEDIVNKFENITPPWSVNAYADIAGRYIFRQHEYIKDSKEYIKRQREFMLSKLREIEDIEVYDTHTNFILIKLLKKTENEVFNSMISKGILIRKASSFEGLNNRYIRVAVKSEKQNEKLIQFLKECI